MATTAERPTAPPAQAPPWWRLRWYELVPEVAVVAGLGFFLVDETDAATSALESTRSVVLGAGTAIAWLGARALTARIHVPPPARALLFGVAAAAVLAVAVLPAYDGKTVVETFPGPAAPPADTAAPPADEGPPEEAPAEPAADEPVRLRIGSFRGIDHRAEGTVAVYRRADGDFVLGLEDFEIQPGPDYDVYVVPGADRDRLDGAVRLDDLRGNRGTQFYDVPAGVDLASGEWTVLVWCETFAVPIANATPV